MKIQIPGVRSLRFSTSTKDETGKRFHEDDLIDSKELGHNAPEASLADEFSYLLGARVLKQIKVDIGARSRPEKSALIDLQERGDTHQADDLLELGWEGGIVELIPAGGFKKRFPEAELDANDVLIIPTREPTRDEQRGLSDIFLKAETR